MHPAGILMVCAVLCAVFCFFRSEWEKKQLKLETYRLETKKLPEGKTLRLVFLSDLHSVSFGESNEALLRLVKEAKPDLILVGGDMLTCGRRHEAPPKTGVCTGLLEGLSELAPVCYGEGNHEARFKRRFPEDYGLFVRHLNQPGNVAYMVNGKIDLDAIGAEAAEPFLKVYGISLEQRFYDPQKIGIGRKETMPNAYIEEKIGKAETEGFRILLMHSPLYLKEAAEWGADLVLSGHFHGGTIRLPWIGGLMTPQFQFFSKESAGLISEGHAKMIVSRGLGTHSVRVRFCNLPEVSLIELAGTEDSKWKN